jgi:gliding motility-associated-like protein
MLQRYLLLFFTLGIVAPAFGQSLEFVRNDGQWEGDFRYKARTANGDAYLGSQSFTYVIGASDNLQLQDEYKHGQKKEVTLKYHTYRMSLEGAAGKPEIVASKEQSWYYNYFLGNKPENWHSEIHPALALDYKGVYPGVDMHFSSQSSNLKYEFVLEPGVDPAIVRLRFEGTDGLGIKDRNLQIRTSVGTVEELRPVAYQYTNDGRREIACNYRVKDNIVSYSFPDGYDKSLPLVIDPVVVFATFTGATSDNWGFTATYDQSGNFYGGGTIASSGFPASTGAFQTTFGGGSTAFPAIPGDMCFVKYNAAGTSIIWASYLGGSDLDQPHSMVVDPFNNLIVAGRSFSSNFPTTFGAYDPSYNGGGDIVITKFNATGTSLLGSTFVGGSGLDGANCFASELTFGSLKYNYGDDARSEVIIDNNQNIYVAGPSSSTNFPITSNAAQATKSGLQDAVFIKLNPTLTALTYSTFLGGSGDDAAYVLALNQSQTAVYVGGGTASPNFPATTGVWKSTYQSGPADGWIARFGNGANYPLQKLTFVGTGNYDQVYGLQTDLENSVYAMGQSLGGVFPVTTGVYSNPNSSQFIIKMDSMLTTNLASTVFGSGSSTTTNISPVAFLVDTCQNVYISGWGGHLNLTDSIPASVGTTTGMAVTPANIPAGSVLKSTTDGADFYFMALSKNLTSLLFGAFYGRSSTNLGFGEHVDGGTSRFDKQGVIYQAICGGCGGGSSPPLPTTPGSHSTTNGSTNCNLASLKIAFQLSAPNAQASGAPTIRGCPPLRVQFANTSVNAITQEWDFMDGSPVDNSFQPAHTFTRAGIYNVRLIIYNPNACKTRDTAYVQVTVDSNRIKSDYSFEITDTCGPYQAVFTNLSTYSTQPGAPARTTFTWYFGDGTSFTGATPPVHNYPGTGTYTAVLVMSDPNACNNPDSTKKVITIRSSRVAASFRSLDTVCDMSPIVFTNGSTNATGIKYDFGDSTTSTSTQPVSHTFKRPGTYEVILVAQNPNTCNKFDTMRKTIRIRPLPIAAFVHAPVIPESNKPITFTNTSKNADRYIWNFGDGSPATDELSPVHLFRKTGSFATCLIAINNEGCRDTVCRDVEADIHTALDLPTGFSPNGDGKNDILFVRGGGIETMNLKIFNRWGEKVFESNSLERGWDGTYNGKLQEIDAYGYVLTATFIDGTSSIKKGNVTLLR